MLRQWLVLLVFGACVSDPHNAESQVLVCDTIIEKCLILFPDTRPFVPVNQVAEIISPDFNALIAPGDPLCMVFSFHEFPQDAQLKLFDVQNNLWGVVSDTTYCFDWEILEAGHISGVFSVVVHVENANQILHRMVFSVKTYEEALAETLHILSPLAGRSYTVGEEVHVSVALDMPATEEVYSNWEFVVYLGQTVMSSRLPVTKGASLVISHLPVGMYELTVEVRSPHFSASILTTKTRFQVLESNDPPVVVLSPPWGAILELHNSHCFHLARKPLPSGQRLRVGVNNLQFDLEPMQDSICFVPEWDDSALLSFVFEVLEGEGVVDRVLYVCSLGSDMTPDIIFQSPLAHQTYYVGSKVTLSASVVGFDDGSFDALLDEHVVLHSKPVGEPAEITVGSLPLGRHNFTIRFSLPGFPRPVLARSVEFDIVPSPAEDDNDLAHGTRVNCAGPHESLFVTLQFAVTKAMACARECLFHNICLSKASQKFVLLSGKNLDAGSDIWDVTMPDFRFCSLEDTNELMEAYEETWTAVERAGVHWIRGRTIPIITLGTENIAHMTLELSITYDALLKSPLPENNTLFLLDHIFVPGLASSLDSNGRQRDDVLNGYNHKILTDRLIRFSSLPDTGYTCFEELFVPTKTGGMANMNVCTKGRRQLPVHEFTTMWDTPRFVEFRDYILRRFNLLDYRAAAIAPAARTNRRVRVGVIVRKNRRRMSNLAELLAGLRALDVEVVELVFDRLPATQQFKTMMETDVLIGVYSSGLYHLLWMPPLGCVIEVTFEGMKDPKHRFFAHTYGLQHDYSIAQYYSSDPNKPPPVINLDDPKFWDTSALDLYQQLLTDWDMTVDVADIVSKVEIAVSVILQARHGT